jgi:uncharacterized membrane protein
MDLRLYLAALWHYSWALMSCAFFTLLGAYSLLTKKSNLWTLWAMFGAAIAFVLVASAFAWQDEHEKLATLEDRLSLHN